MGEAPAGPPAAKSSNRKLIGKTQTHEQIAAVRRAGKGWSRRSWPLPLPPCGRYAWLIPASHALPTLFPAGLQGKLGFNYRVSWYLLYCVLWVSAGNGLRWCGEVMCVQDVCASPAHGPPWAPPTGCPLPPQLHLQGGFVHITIG